MAVDPEESRFDEGISLIKAGKFEEAIDIFSELVEKDERNHKAWNAYGVALSQTIHDESAIHCFENALRLDPDNKIYLRNLNRAKTPPVKTLSRKKTELTPHKKNRGRIYGAALILFCIIVIGGLFVSGLLPGSYISNGIPGFFPGAGQQPGLMINDTPPVMTTIVTPEPVRETPVPTSTPEPEVLFHFIDVSQGDAALVQSEGKNMLIDAGPKSSGGRLVDYLKQQNVTTLDYLVASHPLDDHIGGMTEVLEAFDVKNYVDNGMIHSSDLYKDVISAVISDQAVRMIASAGMTIPFTNTTRVDVIGPHRITGHLDEDSLILRIGMNNISVVFPGDSSEVRGKATILKLPDHGSDTGIGPVMNTRPEAVVISLASGNPFGYPRSATLAEIKKQGSQLFRTDINGTIVIRTDGKTWSARTAR